MHLGLLLGFLLGLILKGDFEIAYLMTNGRSKFIQNEKFRA